jgi:hypothetical protein
MAGQRAKWNDVNTKILLDLCIAEKDKGNFINGLTTEGMVNVAHNFAQATNQYYTEGKISSKLTTLKRSYRDWQVLANRTGLGRGKRGNITTPDRWFENSFPVHALNIISAFEFLQNCSCVWSYNANHVFPIGK